MTERNELMTHDAAAIYRRVVEAFKSHDIAVLNELLAEDVVWHTDDLQAGVPSEFRGRDEFFAAAATPNEAITAWEIIPDVVVSEGNTVFSHQIDKFTLKDGSEKVIHFLLHITINDRGQLQEVWEFGQNALPHGS